MKARRVTKKVKLAPTKTLQTVTKKSKEEPSLIAAPTDGPRASKRFPELTQVNNAVHLRGERVKPASAVGVLRGAEDSFRVVADSLPELICYIDTDSHYQFNNKAYERTYGIPAQEFKGRSVREMMGEAGYVIVQPYIEKALKGERCSAEGYISHRLIGRRYYCIDYVPDKGGDAKVRGAFILIQDLTKLKQAEEKFQTVVETAPDAMVVSDQGGKIILVNSQAERMFGYARRELIGQPVELLMPERFRQTHVGKRTACMEKPVSRTMGTGLELYGRRKDGSELPLEISLSSVETSDGTQVSSTIRDITERKQLADQIRWATILEERSRMARDVHDTLAQGFTGIVLNLEAAEAAAADLPVEVRNRIKRARDVARESLEEARRSVLALSSSLRVSDGLANSIRELVERYRSSTRTRLEFTVQGMALRLDPAVQENLLRVAQQATDNALQHARASLLRIELAFGEKTVQLTITDDGQGFDVRKAGRGLGLTGMRERAEEIGGKCELTSQPGKGTRVEVHVPLRRVACGAAS